MNIIIFTSKKDKSLQSVSEVIDKKGITHDIYLYENMIMKSDVLLDIEENKTIIINPEDRLILRDPYNTGVNYSYILQFLINKYPKNRVLDKEIFIKHPNYEDKLYQSHIFSTNNIPHPKVLHISSLNALYSSLNEIVYPIVVKKRISSRSNDVFIIKSEDDLLNFFMGKYISDYIIQPRLKVKEDYRVIVMKNNIVGSVLRQVKVKKDGTIKVVVKSINENIPNSVRSYIKTLHEVLNGDIIGYDIVIDKEEKIYFLEANLSPQFRGFEKVTGINITEKILDII